MLQGLRETNNNLPIVHHCWEMMLGGKVPRAASIRWQQIRDSFMRYYNYRGGYKNQFQVLPKITKNMWRGINEI